MRAAVTLGVPLVGSQLAGMAMNTTDTVMLGWYGVTELAAGAITTQFWFTVMMFGAGFAYAVVPMAAEAEGRGDVVRVRRAVRMGLWACIGFCLVAMPMLWFTEDLFLLLGQEAEVAALGGEYMRIAQWAMVFLLGSWTLRGFLTAIERTAFFFWVSVAGVVVNAAFNWVFIFGNFGMPELGIRGAAVATLGTNAAVFAAIVGYCALSHRARAYQLFVRFWKPDSDMLRQVFVLGWPISLMITAETGMFIFSSIFMGWFGVIALAAHGVTLQIASIAFMVPMGMAQVATARVGNFVGRCDAIGVFRAAYSVLALCLAFAMLSAVLFLVVPEQLIGLFLDGSDASSTDVVVYAVPLLFVAACFQLVDTAQAIAAANLRGLQDTRMPMVIASICYWIIGLGLAVALGFGFDMGGVGIWIGLAAGLAAAAVALNGRFERIRPAMPFRHQA